MFCFHYNEFVNSVPLSVCISLIGNGAFFIRLINLPVLCCTEKGADKGLDLSYTLLKLLVLNDRAGLYD
ncbi:MAG: hypothetical protein Q4D26_08460 [Clostridia bacterium]|nr:hypothetical protein [Clostridia bacterium]